MSEAKVTARIQVTVEVDAGAPWGAECTAGQIHKQAKESGLNNLMNALKPGMHGIVRVIGEPKVIAIYTETP